MAPMPNVSNLAVSNSVTNDLIFNAGVSGVVKNMYILGSNTVPATGTKVSSVVTNTNTVTLATDLSSNASGNYTFLAGKNGDSTIVFADTTNIKVGHFITGNFIPYVAGRAATGASGQKVLTFDSGVTDIVAGQWVSGTGIDPANRVKVDSVDTNAKTVTLTHNLVEAASGNNYRFYVAVTAVADNTVTLSAALTGNISGSHAFTTSAGFSGQNRILFTTNDITNVVVGHPVSGTGIPAGTTVTGICLLYTSPSPRD